MIEYLGQIKEDWSIDPHTVQDQEKVSGKLYVNQIVKVKVSGAEKERSLKESNLLHACFKVVADNFEGISGDPFATRWNTPWKVKIQVKIDLKFIEGFVVTNDNVQAMLKSLSFTKTDQAESHKFIKDAIKYMAIDILGLESADKLVEIAKSRMQRR